MTIHLLITIDTEIDKAKDWRVSSNESFSSVTTGIPDKLTNIFSKYGARPTYLLSPEVIRNDACVSILKDCELGTHMHGDMIEPFCHQGPMANMSTENGSLFSPPTPFVIPAGSVESDHIGILNYFHSIVNDDHLEVLTGLLQDRFQGSTYVLTLIVKRDDDGHRWYYDCFIISNAFGSFPKYIKT